MLESGAQRGTQTEQLLRRAPRGCGNQRRMRSPLELPCMRLPTELA